MGQPLMSNLTAADIMQSHVRSVESGNTLQDAMLLMTQNHVTGLPVVSSSGKCVGVITASNILAYDQELMGEHNAELLHHFDPDRQRWERVASSASALDAFGQVRIDQVMEPDVITVQADTPLNQVARRMKEARIHRVFVLDETDRLVGVISSFDFVALCASS